MDDFLQKVRGYFNLSFIDGGVGELGKALASDTSLGILDVLSKEDRCVGVTAQELSLTLGIARTTVIYHLGRLQETGLVEMNPALSDWSTFWEDYRKGRVAMPQDDFNRVHDARMKGEKLYIPTRKGVLFLPTDAKTGESMLMEAFSAISTPRVEAYRDTLKAAAAAGIMGIFLLAVSFMYGPAVQPLPASPPSLMVADYASPMTRAGAEETAPVKATVRGTYYPELARDLGFLLTGGGMALAASAYMGKRKREKI